MGLSPPEVCRCSFMIALSWCIFAAMYNHAELASCIRAAFSCGEEIQKCRIQEYTTEKREDFVRYQIYIEFYISVQMASSQWKCSNLIYLAVLPFLSHLLCYVAHSSDLGMIIIGLGSLSCRPSSADVVECMYMNTPTDVHINEGAKHNRQQFDLAQLGRQIYHLQEI